MVTGDEPQLGGKQERTGNEPCLGGEDWQGLRCDWCEQQLRSSGKFRRYYSSSGKSAYNLCLRCLAKVRGIDHIRLKSLRRLRRNMPLNQQWRYPYIGSINP